MLQEFSHRPGSTAAVYHISDGLKLLFPQADLVRTDTTNDPTWYERLYLRHKIAHLLFPKHFIEVVGSQVTPSELTVNIFEGVHGKMRFYPLREHRLFSKLATVPAEHATFSAHMELDPTSELGKVSTCDCNECQRHRQFHQDAKLEPQAEKIAKKLNPKGLFVPSYDPSDYCLTAAGSLVFFEIDDFNRQAVGKYLESLKQQNPNQQFAWNLLQRMNLSHRASRFSALYEVRHDLRLN